MQRAVLFLPRTARLYPPRVLLDPGTAITAAGVELDSLAQAAGYSVALGVGAIGSFAVAVRLFAISADRRAGSQATAANFAFAGGLIAVAVVIGAIVAGLIALSG